MGTEARCLAKVYRGQWSTLRSEACGKPAKGERAMYGADAPVPVCGVHLRARYPVPA